MKNNRGLTLIELVAVLVILVIVGAIAIPKVFEQVKQYKEQMYLDQVEIIKDAARSWSTDHTEELPNVVDESCYVTFEQLQMDGYLDPKFKSTSSDKPFLPTSYVEIRCTVSTDTNYQYTYIYHES